MLQPGQESFPPIILSDFLGRSGHRFYPNSHQLSAHHAKTGHTAAEGARIALRASPDDTFSASRPDQMHDLIVTLPSEITTQSASEALARSLFMHSAEARRIESWHKRHVYTLSTMLVGTSIVGSTLPFIEVAVTSQQPEANPTLIGGFVLIGLLGAIAPFAPYTWYHHRLRQVSRAYRQPGSTPLIYVDDTPPGIAWPSAEDL